MINSNINSTQNEDQIYIIGDVHGCYKSLLALIEQFPNKQNSKIVFVGDLVDRGNDSYNVVKFIIENKSRLDLTKYNKEAPLDESVIPVKRVKIMLSQHIGAPASCVVKPGDMVVKGQMIAEPAKGLSVGIHASVNGLVSEVNEKYVVIETQEGRADNE